MTIKLSGYVRVKVVYDGECEEFTINANDFSEEEGGVYHIGEGDYEYQGIYKYFGDGFSLEFSATNYNGCASISECEVVEGAVEIVDDSLFVRGKQYDPEDYF
ncbi:hypothetical protein [Aeromonas dhakensis]|uniref:hypothetical protein n=1 Tax=Aeromonas dhakensis TaxID=196024 RepID=UPI0038CFD9DC